MAWNNSCGLHAKNFVCGYCGHDVTPALGFSGTEGRNIYICHHCDRPNFFDADSRQTPGALFGHNVEGITDEKINKLYDEARQSYGSNSFTASVMCCRKILMHIAVSLGLEHKKGLSFEECINYLDKEGHIPKGSKNWVDSIRKKGNEANHEITLMSQEEAKELISFTEMLLKLIYEYPSRASKEKTSE